MTHSEGIQHIWPGLSDEDAKRLLWEATCYPFGDWNRVEMQLREKHEQSGGDVQRAIDIAHEETDVGMAEHRRTHL